MNSANERNTTWTPEKLRQLLADKASGMTDIQLGEKHGVSSARIYNLRKKAERLIEQGDRLDCRDIR